MDDELQSNHVEGGDGILTIRGSGTRRASTGILLAVACALGTTSLHGQAASRTSSIPDTPTCAGCRVATRELAVLGGTSIEAGFDAIPEHALRDGKGRYWVATGSGLTKVFSASGSFLKSVGTKGRGPNEFSRASYLAKAGDSVIVVDDAQSRFVVVGPDLIPRRTITLPISPKPVVVVTWPTNIWTSGILRTPQGAGWPLHRLAVDISGGSNALASFGPDKGDARPDELPSNQWIAASTGGNVWTVEQLRYRITRWTDQGHIVESIDRAPGWFVPNANTRMGGPSVPPSAWIGGIREAGDGLLWVFANLPSPNWRDAWAGVSLSNGRGEVPLRRVAMDKLWRTTAELLDLKTRRVVLRHEFPSWILCSLDEDKVAAVRVSGEGFPQLVVLQLTVIRPAQTPS